MNYCNLPRYIYISNYKTWILNSIWILYYIYILCVILFTPPIEIIVIRMYPRDWNFHNGRQICRFSIFLGFQDGDVKKWGKIGILMDIEYYWILVNIIEYFWILVNIIEYYWILVNIIEYFWIILNISEYVWILLHIIEYYYWIFLNISEYFWILLNIIEYYWYHVSFFNFDIPRMMMNIIIYPISLNVSIPQNEFCTCQM